LPELKYRPLKTLFTSTFKTYVSLLKVMVPAILIIKVLEMIGAIDWLAKALDPVMGIMGLPGEAGLVWATCLMANIFAAIVVLFTHVDYSSFTVMQTTILAGLMLIGHALIVEGAIAKKVGLHWGFTLLFRIVGAIVFGVLINFTCTHLGLLQQTVSLDFIPQSQENQSLAGWAVDQLYGLVLLYLILFALVTLILIMKKTGTIHFLEKLLAPVLSKLGISEHASYMTLIGMTLGLAYGGGLLLHESQKETLSKRDIFLSISLISICHSLIEDTLVVMLIGPSLVVVLFFRLAYALIIVFMINKIKP